MGKPTLAEIDRRNLALLATLHSEAHPPEQHGHLDLRLRSVLGAIDPSHPQLQRAWEHFVTTVLEVRDEARDETAEPQGSTSGVAAAISEGMRTTRRRRRGGVSSRPASQPQAERRPRASDLAPTGPRSADILFRHPRSRLPFTPRVVETLSRPRSPSLDDEPPAPFSPRPGLFPDSYAEMFTGDREAAGEASEPVRPRAGNVPYDLRQIFTLSGAPASTTRPTTVAPVDLIGRDPRRPYRSAPPDEEEHAGADMTLSDLADLAYPGTYADAVRRSMASASTPLPLGSLLDAEPWGRMDNDAHARSPPLYLDPMVHRQSAEAGPISLNEGSSAWAAEYERMAGRHAGTVRRRSDDYESRASQMPPPTLRRTRRRIGEGDDRRRDSVRDSPRDRRRDGIVFPAGFEDYLSIITAEDDGRAGDEATSSAAASVDHQLAAFAQLAGVDEATATELAAPLVPTRTDTTAATAATSVAGTPTATQAPHTTHSSTSDRPIASLPRRLRLGAD